MSLQWKRELVSNTNICLKSTEKVLKYRNDRLKCLCKIKSLCFCSNVYIRFAWRSIKLSARLTCSKCCSFKIVKHLRTTFNNIYSLNNSFWFFNDQWHNCYDYDYDPKKKRKWKCLHFPTNHFDYMFRRSNLEHQTSNVKPIKLSLLVKLYVSKNS